MMAQSPNGLMIRKLESIFPLTEEERQALASLPMQVMTFKPDQDIVGSAEFLEFSFAQPQPANPLPQIADRNTSLSADLNERAALEIDPVIQTVDEKYQNRSDAQNAGQQKTKTGIPHERQIGTIRNKANSMEHKQFPPSKAEPLWGDMTTASRR